MEFLNIESIYLIVATIIFGITIKLADAHDEHGMKSFPWAAMIYGVLWWISWAYIISFSSEMQALYLSIIFYWIYKFKIDYPNHAIWTIIMLFWAFMFKWQFLYLETFLLLWSYISFDYFKRLNKNKLKNNFLTWFFKYKPQFIIWPVLFAIIYNYPLIMTYYIVIYLRNLIIEIFKIDQND